MAAARCHLLCNIPAGRLIASKKLEFLKRLRANWERTHPGQRSKTDWENYAREFTSHAERWLDEGFGKCHFRESQWSENLNARLNHFQDQRYQVTARAIMPNHCHLVIRPYPEHDLENLVGAMKGVTARAINKAHGEEGAIWEEESYDRIVRDAEHLWRVIQYIGRNPRLAGLQNEEAWRRWIHPEWEAAGWRFVDEK